MREWQLEFDPREVETLVAELDPRSELVYRLAIRLAEAGRLAAELAGQR